MTILKQWVWPVVAGFVVASAVMMAFELTNSFFYPLPADLDWYDTAAVQALTKSLPWTAFILVILGWAVGSFCGGYITSRLAGETRFRVTAVLAILLVLAGIANVLMLGHPMVFTIIGLAVLAVFPYLGYLAYRVFEKK
ncbi:MAG: hypothetical protein RLZZ342_192 [Candidatus Parcubacteria bacterium]|jgi:hypothetical protein